MSSNPLQIGWAETDITPVQWPVALAGQFRTRISEGVKDPLTATVCAMASGGEQAIFVSCDILQISNDLRDEVLEKVKALSPEIAAGKIVISATHTHTAPEVWEKSIVNFDHPSDEHGIPLEIQPARVYRDFLSGQLAKAIVEAWNARQPAGIAYGIDCAVIGANRRWVDHEGRATMFGLNAASAGRFSHIEGYEDHAVQIVAVYDLKDSKSALTGIIVNVACPSQVDGDSHQVSSDFWCQVRSELCKRLGREIFILPQVSAAGDQCPHLMLNREAEERMQKLRGRTRQEEIAARIAEAVERILPCIHPTIDHAPVLRHHCETVHLPLDEPTPDDLRQAREGAEKFQQEYEQEKQKLTGAAMESPRWYTPVTAAYRRMLWHRSVERRAACLKTEPVMPVEVHVVRLGEIAFASNPFEYYLDYGSQIQLGSPAVQTFLVQLAGQGTYLPSLRSVKGGGYGSMAASAPVGPEGGRILKDYTVQTLAKLF